MYKKKFYCINCEKLLGDPRSIRCHSCEAKRRWKKGILINKVFGKKHPQYKDGRWTVNQHYCDLCGMEITRGHLRCSHCKRIGSKQSEQTKRKLSLQRRGKNNPSWKGGISILPYSFQFNIKLKEKIRKRDDYQCQICHHKGKEVHHIDYNKKNCKENNLITLCKSCHAKTNEHRKSWQAFFAELKRSL